MSTMRFKNINDNKLTFVKFSFDGDLELALEFSDGNDDVLVISSGEMVMLANYYKHIKHNDIQCDFINPDGT